MRTALAFFLGAALVSATWVMAGPSQTTKGLLNPAISGPATVEGLGEPVTDFGWESPGGETARLSELLGQGPLVVAIRDLSCPVSQRYGMTLQKLEEEFSAKGVRFLYVDLTPSEAGWSPGMARDQAYLKGTYVREIGEEFFSGLRPRTTTEAFLIDGSGVLRYRGAIDDQFGVDFARQSPDRRFLADAIRATLRQVPPPTGSTFAPGCYLASYSEARTEPDPDPEIESPAPPDYAMDIQPLIEESCVACHSEGGSGPFALDRYEALAAHAEEIRSVVSQERMPPWPANSQYGPWANDPRLSALEKGRILRWIDAGMPRSEPGTAERPVATPTEESSVGWRHGQPDAVLSAAEPPTVREGEVGLTTFYIPTDFGEDRWVSGAEILPSTPDAVVQAVLLLEDPNTPEAERSFGLEGFFAGYAAGYEGALFPTGTAKLLPASAWLKLQVHYRPRTLQIQDQTRIGLTFTDQPRRGVVETRSAFATGFEIPSHASHHAVTAEHLFPVGGEIHSFTPQMNLRGSAIRYVLVDPSGGERTLLDIPRYDFQLRMRYVLTEPVPVEAGSKLRVTGWFDNSEANMANPDPSVSASFGSELTDELLIGYFDFVPDGPGPAALTEPEDDRHDRDQIDEHDDEG